MTIHRSPALPSTAAPDHLLADAAVSHDLCHLLSLVAGFARLEEQRCREHGTSHDTATSLCSIRRAAERAIDICRDVGMHARGEEMPLVEFDLTAMANDLALIFHGRGVAPLDLAGPDTVLLHGRRLAIERAALNLLWNAYAATDEVEIPRVQLRWGQDARHAWLEVVDNGPGLPTRLHGDLSWMEPGADQAARGSGSGLGLALAAQVMRNHNGRLLGRARGDGSGAVLRLEFDTASGQ